MNPKQNGNGRKPASPHPRTLVMKFGGTSVGTAEAMRQAVAIIAHAAREWDRLVVVTSALSGVTDQLIAGATGAAVGDSGYIRAASVLRERHQEIIDALVGDLPRRAMVRQEVDHLVNDFSDLCHAIGVLGEATPRALDAVAALGERLSVRVLAAAAESAGLPALPVESTQLIVTDDHFQNALPDMAVTALRTREALEPALHSGRVPVVTGFIGATPGGQVTTLGRGGSDFSASILGVALNASEVWIWTDVDGVMTADPRLVPDARTLPVLSYREVAEMAHYGAKVLQPRSIYPVIQAGIPVRVCNTFNPSNPGTRLVSEKESNGHGTIKAMAVLSGLRMGIVAGRGMIGVPGIAGRVFSAIAAVGVSIPLIVQSSSEQSINFAIPRASAEKVLGALQKELEEDIRRGDIDHIESSEAVEIITVVSPGMRSSPGVTGRIFSKLGSEGVNILAISFGASDVSINVVVAEADTRRALTALHALALQEQEVVP